MIKGHNQGIMNDRRSQFSVMNDIVNDQKGHNIVNDSFAHKPDNLLVIVDEDEIPMGSMTEWEREHEQEEFARAASLYRPLNFTMASRFTSAKFSDDAETVEMPAEQAVSEKRVVTPKTW